MSTAKTSSTLLAAKLAGVRGKRLGLALGTGVAWLLVAAVALLGTAMIADWKWDFSHSIRQALLALDALVLLLIAARHIARVEQIGEERAIDHLHFLEARGAQAGR